MTVGATLRILPWLAAACLLAAVTPAAGQEDYTVSATANAPGGAMDTSPIRLEIKIQGEQRPEVNVGRLPAMTNLRVIDGPSTASFDRWINGRSSSTVTLTYTLMANGPGEAAIPPIPVEVQGRTYRTDPIRFDVTRGSPPAPQSSPGKERDPAAPPGGDGLDVHLRAEISDQVAYVGQPVALKLELISGLTINGMDWAGRPTFSNFWVEDEAVDPDRERYTKRVGDRRYVVFPLERKVLIPTSAGEFVVDPYAVQVRISRSTGDVFQDFFRFNRGTRILRKSEPLRLKVLPLPEEGKPDSFGGAVGTFDLEATLDRTEAAVDEAVALRVTVRGSGFLKSVSPPALQAPPDFKLFEPKVQEQQSVQGGELRSSKTWEWIMVPLSAGELRLPEIRFGYFDTATGTYREHVRDNLLVTVQRGEGVRDRIAAGGRLRPQRREIEYIKPRRGSLSERTTRVHARGWYLLILFLPLGIVPLAIVAGRWYARMQKDQGRLRSRKARSRARRRLASVEKRKRSQDSSSFHEDIARALVEYVADRFDRSAAGLTYDLADDLLASRAVPQELRHRFRSCLESCDFARFVPASGNRERRAETLASAYRVVDDLEKAL